MAYPGNFLKFSFGGKLAGGEDWTNSINLALVNLAAEGEVVATDTLLNDQLNDFTANLETFFAAVRAYVSPTTTLEWSKLAVIGPDGRYAAAPVSRPIEPMYGSSPLIYPNQIALALSMQSDAWGARGKNGRIFLAGASVKLSGDGRMEVEPRNQIATAFAAFIEGLNDSGKFLTMPNVGVVIASAVGEGAFNPVTRVRVGRVFDTIRSRRTSLTEDYGTVEIG